MNKDTKSGPHIGKVRSWIQWNFVNGSDVTWGSDDYLQGSSKTVRDMETLAQDIRDVAVAEEMGNIKRILKTMDRIVKELDKLDSPDESNKINYDSLKWDLMQTQQNLTTAMKRINEDE